MRADAFFMAARRLPIRDLDEVTRGGGLVVVAPHPDDESLGCGGLIAQACQRGVAVELVIVSDGVGSHPKSRRYPAERLRALREDETRAAAAALALPDGAIRFLRLPDRHVPTQGAAAEAARNAIIAAAAACRAGAVCVTWAHDPHCDHLAAAGLVEAARARLEGARILAYPIWGWTLPSHLEVGDPPRGLRLDVSRQLAAKRDAIAAHLSQTTDLIDDDPTGFRLTAEMIENFVGRFEILLDTEVACP